MSLLEKYDVVVLGCGLAGLSLCRQLLLETDKKTILLVDNRTDLPGNKQKVGESLVQLAGYYFTRVLDLEEHLLREHYPKYNLRFYWKTAGKDNRNMEDYSSSFICKSSSVSTYQLNRNKLEEHLLQTALQSPRVTLCTPISSLRVDLSESGPHRIQFQANGSGVETSGEWVVDTTGRGQFLKKKQSLRLESPIRHGSSWCWVEGLVNIDKLTDLSAGQARRQRDLHKQGLFPVWLATNHFCGEGFWFWVIPLQGITSLGVVYDSTIFPHEKVSTAEKLIAWACEEFPLFKRDLPLRKIVDSSRLTDYAYDCQQTISPKKWALSGMSGRFTDPLYSPGSDLISVYNTAIVDAIKEEDPVRLEAKAALYEPLMKVIYDAYVPTYAVSYDALGDQEVFTLKYSWELAVYFSFYVFPFINNLFTDARFLPGFFRKFAQLGPINHNLQQYMSDYYQWKKQFPCSDVRVAKELLDLTPLKKAEAAYYRIVASAQEADEALETHLELLKEFARFIYAYISSVVVGDNQALVNQSFVSGINLGAQKFDSEALRRDYAEFASCSETFDWNLDPSAMESFHSGPKVHVESR